MNLQYQQDGRVIAFPFHFLNNNGAMNIEPKNYSWPGFYEHVIDLTRYSFSPRAIVRRARSTSKFVPKWLNVVRAISSEGYGRIDYYSEILRRLNIDPQFRPFFERQTTKIPQFYSDLVKKDMGPLWDWLPKGALEHDPNAYLKSMTEEAKDAVEVRVAV